VPRAFTETGRLADANTLLTAWISLKISISDLSSVSASPAEWKLPPPALAMPRMKFGYRPSLDAPVTATPCVTMPCAPSRPLTSTPRMKRANSSAQFFWSVLLTTEVG